MRESRFPRSSASQRVNWVNMRQPGRSVCRSACRERYGDCAGQQNQS